MKPVLFIDFDGTICHDLLWRSAPPHTYKKIQEYLFTHNKKMVSDWMRGEYSSEDITRILSDTLSEDYDLLWNIFVIDCKNLRVEKHILEQIDALRKTYTIAMVTDNMDSFARFSIPSLSLTDYFDYIFDSYTEKILKSDSPNLFERALEKMSIEPAQTTLIDDSQKSCIAFELSGGKSCPITKEKDIVYWLNTL